MGLFWLALAASLQAAQASPPATTLAQASASLDGKTQCVPFKWVSDDATRPRGAISVPVAINGKPMSLQLDTGADATILYGHAADRAGWSKPGQESFRAVSMGIGSTAVDRSMVYVNANMEEDPRLVGTLGLPAMMGRVAVLDYPRQRFCLFEEADLPAALASATYVRGDLRNTKFFVPVTVGAFHSDAVVFDTGSSELPLHVDFPNWTKLTGRQDTKNVPTTYQGSSWGKPVTFSGAPVAEILMVGQLALGHPVVFTQTERPTMFADWPFRADGVLGNALLWDGVVVLDMTAKMRLGYIR